jgi:hypothetical protein
MQHLGSRVNASISGRQRGTRLDKLTAGGQKPLRRTMNERAAISLGALAGAVIGGLAGYLFLTESGRRLRAEWEPTLEEVFRNAAALRNTVERASVAATEGWRTVSEAAPSSGWSGSAQNAPF